jgi:hypothetical protein
LGLRVPIRSGSAKASANKLLLRVAFFIGLLIINGIIVAAASSCDDVEECISWTLSLDPDSGGEEQESDFDPPGEPDDRSDTLPTVCCTSPSVGDYPFLNVTSLLFSVHPLLALRPPNAS